LIVTGNFGNINGQERGGIALIDTTGSLMNDYFSGNGCGEYLFQYIPSQPPSQYYRVISKIIHAPDGSYYIYGAYNGYDDGTTNDHQQRSVSRMHGLKVSIAEYVVGDAR